MVRTITKLVILLLALAIVLPGAVSAEERQGELRLIGVPSDVMAGRYDNQSGIFYADVQDIPDAYVEITYDDMVIISKMLEWNTKDEILQAFVDVKVTTEDTTVTSQKLTYWEAEDKSQFEEDVVVVMEDGTFYGENFVMFAEEERMEFFGPFRGVFNQNEDQNEDQNQD